MIKKNKKTIIIVLVLLAVAVLIYFIFFKKTTPTAAPGAAATLPKANLGTAQPAVEEFPLKVGSQGGYVKLLQQFLNLNNKGGYPPLVEDGIFGTLTEKALLSTTNKKELTKADLDSFLNLVNVRF